MSLRTWFRDWLNAPSKQEREDRARMLAEDDAEFERELERLRAEPARFGSPRILGIGQAKRTESRAT